MLKICGVDEYVQGLVSRPNPNVDSQGAKAWAFNDTYAKC